MSVTGTVEVMQRSGNPKRKSVLFESKNFWLWFKGVWSNWINSNEYGCQETTQAYRAKRLDVLTDEEKVRTLWMYLENKDLSVRRKNINLYNI